MPKVGEIYINRINQTRWVVIGGKVKKNVRIAYVSGYKRKWLVHIIRRYFYPIRFENLEIFSVLYYKD